jgi:hypothetical protein
MSAPVIRSEVKAFVSAVRAALDDLGPDEVEELAVGGVRPGAAGSVVRVVRGAWRSGGGAARRAAASRWWPMVREYVRMLRPVWWVLRAWIAFQVLHQVVGSSRGSVLPQSLRSLATALVVLVVSVELGRRTVSAERNPLWQNPFRRRLVIAGLLVAGNLLAVLAAPVVFAHINESPPFYVNSYPVPPVEGLWLNGTEARNIFPYDAQGRPLSGVQLFTENGDRLTVGISARTR